MGGILLKGTVLFLSKDPVLKGCLTINNQQPEQLWTTDELL